jgi:NAD(P)H-nitrite reductase large subunit
MPPYERPPLSKGFLAGKDSEASLFINDDAFYRSHGIELRLRTPVASVDAQHKQLRAHQGETIGYESLLVATGSRVRTLDLPAPIGPAFSTCAPLTMRSASAHRQPAPGRP